MYLISEDAILWWQFVQLKHVFHRLHSNNVWYQNSDQKIVSLVSKESIRVGWGGWSGLSKITVVIKLRLEFFGNGEWALVLLPDFSCQRRVCFYADSNNPRHNTLLSFNERESRSHCCPRLDPLVHSKNSCAGWKCVLPNFETFLSLWVVHVALNIGFNT